MLEPRTSELYQNNSCSILAFAAGGQQGPWSAEVIKSYWDGGYVNETTFFFAADNSMTNWAYITDIVQLHEFCVPPAPLAPPPLAPPLEPPPLAPPPLAQPPLAPPPLAPPPMAVTATDEPKAVSALLSGIQSFNISGLKSVLVADDEEGANSAGGGGGGGMGGLLAEIQKRAPKRDESADGGPIFEIKAALRKQAGKRGSDSELRVACDECGELHNVQDLDDEGLCEDCSTGGTRPPRPLTAEDLLASLAAGVPTKPQATEAATTAAASVAAPLPKVLCSWVAQLAADGTTFYNNTDTGEWPMEKPGIPTHTLAPALHPHLYLTDAGESQWEKPDELKSDEEKAREGAWVWLPDPTDAFVAYRIVSARGSDGSFVAQREESHPTESSSGSTGVERRVEAKEAARAIALEPSHLQRAPPSDLVMVS